MISKKSMKNKILKFLKKLPLKTLNLIWRIILMIIITAFRLFLALPFSLFNKLMKHLDYHYRIHTIYILIIINMIVFNNLFVIGCDYKEKLNKPIVKSAQAQTEEKLEKEYEYNEKVPKEVVRMEIISQASKFGLGIDTMLKLAECESNFDNLAKNPKGTATGVYQFTIATWHETASWRNRRIAPTSYKANIREAMIDISNGEEWRWECWNY